MGFTVDGLMSGILCMCTRQIVTVSDGTAQQEGLNAS